MSMKSYKAAMTNKIKLHSGESVPLNHRHRYSPSEHHEYAYYSGGVHHVRTKFRQYLGPISLTRSSVAAGELVERGIFPINPNAFGGRLAVLGETFEQCKFEHLIFHYAPVVDATEAGALVMFYTNDVGMPMYLTGETQMQHAFGMDNVCPFQVWDTVSLTVRPSDLLNTYVDDDSASFAMQSQGFLSVIAETDISPPGGSQEYGLMIVEGEAVFSSDEVDYSVASRVSDTLTVTYTNTVHNWDKNEPVTWVTDATSTTLPEASFSVNGLSIANLAGKVFYGTCETVSTASNEQTWYTASDSTVRTFAPGQGFVFHCSGVDGKDFVNVSVFADFESGVTGDSATIPSVINSPGQLVCAADDVSSSSGTMTFKLWELKYGN